MWRFHRARRTKYQFHPIIVATQEEGVLWHEKRRVILWQCQVFGGAPEALLDC